jgi:hypothetical protein
VEGGGWKVYKLQWGVWMVGFEKIVGLEGVDEKMRDVAKKAAEKMVKVRNKVEEERKKQEAERKYEDETWRRSIPYSYMFD